MKHRLSYSLDLTLPYLQQPFEIETDASEYAIGAVLTQQEHLVAYHSETLSNTVHKYPTSDKEMYSIVQACRQWKQLHFGEGNDHPQRPSTPAVHADTREVTE